MIEDIKKEILKNCNVHKIETDDYGNTKRYIHIEIEKFYEILDKYKDKEIKFDDGSSKYAVVKVPVVQIKNKYKNAWEELKEDCREVEKDNDYILYERLQQLEQKHGIEVKE